MHIGLAVNKAVSAQTEAKPRPNPRPNHAPPLKILKSKAGRAARHEASLRINNNIIRGVGALLVLVLVQVFLTFCLVWGWFGLVWRCWCLVKPYVF